MVTQIAYFSCFFISASVLLFIIIYALNKSSIRGYMVFILFCFSSLIFTIADFFSVLSSTPETALFFFNFRFIGLAGNPVIFFLLADVMTSSTGRISITIRSLPWMIPVLTQIMIWTNSYHGLWLSHNPEFGYHDGLMLPDLSTRKPAVWFHLHVFYSYFCLIFGMGRILYSGIRNNRLFISQMITLFAGWLFMIGSALVPTFNLIPGLRFNVIVLGLAVSSMFYALAMFRYGLMDIVPVSRSLLIDCMEEAMLVLDSKLRILDFNPAFSRIFETLQGYAPRTGAVLPELFQDLAPNLISNQNDFFFPLIRKGKTDYFEVSYHPVKQSSDSADGALLIFRNVTDKLRTEYEIQKLKSAVEQSTACVVITDLEGAIEYVNPAFTTLTGYTFEEIRGKKSNFLKSGTTPPETYQDLWQTLKAGNQWRGEFHNVARDGRLFWESAIISPVRDSRGLIHNYVAVKEDVSERKRKEFQLKEEASTDGLTGLTNRRHFDLILSKLLERSKPVTDTMVLTLLMVDVDDFKKINDTHGHAVGDIVLKTVAQRLIQSLRTSDTAARIGGEEFAALLPGSGIEEAVRIAERLRLAVKGESIRVNDVELQVTVSIGIAGTDSEKIMKPDEILAHADEAMYQAKRNGKDQAVEYQSIVGRIKSA